MYNIITSRRLVRSFFSPKKRTQNGLRQSSFDRGTGRNIQPDGGTALWSRGSKYTLHYFLDFLQRCPRWPNFRMLAIGIAVRYIKVECPYARAWFENLDVYSPSSVTSLYRKKK